MHVACKCHDLLCKNPTSCGNDTCRGNAKTRVVKMPRLITWKTFFHGKPWNFTCKILCGVMHVHACKSEVINERYCNTLSIYPDDVYQILIQLDVSKACGPDLICLHLLKKAASIISSSLASLFNKSIQDGFLPED